MIYPLNHRFFFISLFLSLPLLLFSQSRKEVMRSTVISDAEPIRNVYVHPDGYAWVGSAEKLYQAYDMALVTPQVLKPGEQSLAQLPDGNTDLRWSKEEMKRVLGGEKRLSCGYYDERKDVLYIGTEEDGLFLLETEPGLRLKERMHSGNSKLKTNRIKNIIRGRDGRLWVGTAEGVLVGADGKWKLMESDLDVDGVSQNSIETWVAAYDELFIVDDKDDWYVYELPEGSTEGRIKDIAWDTKGNLWILSQVITQYQVEQEKSTIYGPADYFTSEYANRIEAGADGRVWVGTDDKGLYLLDKASLLAVDLQVRKPLGCDPSQKDAELQVRVSGGAEPYSFEWSGGLQGENPRGVGAGKYYLTVTDSKGKAKTSEISVEANPMELTLEQTRKESALGASDASATLSVSGGQAPYQVQWDNGETGLVAEKLSEGTHQVTVVDQRGCGEIGEIEILRELKELEVSINNVRGISCHGEAEGKLEAKVSGGRQPYAYAWSFGNGKSEVVENLPKGAYTVTVTDADGKQAVAEFSLQDPKPLEAFPEVTASANTDQQDGVAQVEVTGGTMPYTYAWDTGTKAARAENLGAGTHAVTITDANGCQVVASVEMTEDILPLQAKMEMTQEIPCPGQARGALKVEVSGGKTPYRYVWSEADLQGAEVKGLTAGEYSLTITDEVGTTKMLSYTLSEPKALEADIRVKAPATTNQSDGQAAAKVSGGTLPYTYAWDSGESGEEAEQLAPGTRTLTVTDANGCTAVATAEISEDILPLDAEGEFLQGISCAGQAEASLRVKVSGGKGPYSFQWSDPNLEGDVLNNLTAGKYEVTVTDAAGSSKKVSYTIQEPNSLQAGARIKSPASTGGSDGKATATAAGGTAPFTYAWDNGERGETASGLTPGAHTLTVTDAKGCTATATVEIPEDILPLAAEFELIEGIPCAGQARGALRVTVSGGKSPYEYAWSDPSYQGDAVKGLTAGKYEVTITDVVGTTKTLSFTLSEPAALQASIRLESPASTNNSDGVALAEATGGAAPYTYAWDNGERKVRAEGLAPGSHSLTVTDANGCTATATGEVSENILPLAAELELIEGIPCAGQARGALRVNVSGGKSPYTYSWSDPSYQGDAVKGLTAGQYEVTVTDVIGTTKTLSYMLKEPAVLQASVRLESPASTNNSDGVVLAEATGGTAPYTYAWDNGERKVRAEGLAPGAHTLTVTDANGCSATATGEVSENILPLAAELELIEGIPCAGQARGALRVEVSGGKSPYKYAWSDPSYQGDAVKGLTAGKYEVTITDVAGTTKTLSYTLQEPAALQASVRLESSASTNNSDGVALAEATGGTAPYTYVWDNGERKVRAEGLAPGAHTLTVTDANGCSATATGEVSENILPLQAELELTQPIPCAGEARGAVKVNVSGGKSPYTYTWSDPNYQGDAVKGLVAGKYEVTVTDAAGQQQRLEITLDEPAPLEVSITDVKRTRTEDSNDGRATAEVRGGVKPYTFAWDNGEDTPAAQRLGVGLRSVTVTDAKGCTASAEAEVKKRIIPELSAGILSEGQTIRIKQLQFEADSTKINEQSKPVLREVAQFLSENPGIVVEIGGHTNGIPEHKYCDWLSTERAKAVADFIVGQGVDGRRVYYKGYGKREPIATNFTEEGRALNQRVEIKVLKVGEG